MKGGLASMMLAVHDLAGQERRARPLRLRGRRGVRGGRAARLRLPRRAGLHRRLRDHRRADRHAHRHPGQGRAGDAHRGDRHRRPRLHALGRATTRCSRRSTSSARSRRCPSRASRPTCSTGPRSTSAGSSAATRSTRSPTCARSTSTSATCPARTHEEIRAAVDALPDARVVKVFHRRPAIVDRDNPFVQALGEAIGRVAPPPGEQISVGRDGASDAISFLEAGVPAVECGPPAPATTGPRSGCRSGRSGNIGRRWSSSSTCSPPAWARTSARCGSPDARGHPPPRTLEAPPAGRGPRRVRGRRGHDGGGASTRWTRWSRRSSSAPSSSSARASSPPPTRASRRR